MRSHIVTIALSLFGAVLLAPSQILAAYNDLQFPQASDIVLTGTSPNITLIVSAGSNLNSITVYPAYLVVVLERDANGVSSITFTSNDRYLLTNSAGIATSGGSTSSSITLTGPATIGTTTVSITPQLVVCSTWRHWSSWTCSNAYTYCSYHNHW